MFKNSIVFVALFFISSQALAMVTLVESSDAGVYSNSTCTLMNSDPSYADPGPYTLNDYKSASYPTAQDPCALDFVLDNWLRTSGLSWLNSKKMFGVRISNNWAPGTEVEVIYQTDTMEMLHAVDSIDVDNGILVWGNGEYLGENRRSGQVAGIYVFNMGEVKNSDHFLRALNDYGDTHGYLVEIINHEFIPGLLGSRLHFRLIE